MFTTHEKLLWLSWSTCRSYINCFILISFPHSSLASSIYEGVTVVNAYNIESPSFRDRASVAIFSFSFLYMISKSKPYILETHFCYSLEATLWSRKYFKLSWFVFILKWVLSKYWHHFLITYRIGIISFSYVDLTKSLDFNFWLSKAMGLPSCMRTALIPCLEASNSMIIILVKSGVTKTGVVVMDTFRLLKASVVAFVYMNESFFNNYVKGATILAYPFDSTLLNLGIHVALWCFFVVANLLWLQSSLDWPWLPLVRWCALSTPLHAF